MTCQHIRSQRHEPRTIITPRVVYVLQSHANTYVPSGMNNKNYSQNKFFNSQKLISITQVIFITRCNFTLLVHILHFSSFISCLCLSSSFSLHFHIYDLVQCMSNELSNIPLVCNFDCNGISTNNWLETSLFFIPFFIIFGHSILTGVFSAVLIFSIARWASLFFISLYY